VNKKILIENDLQLKSNDTGSATENESARRGEEGKKE
jgi:hypothetical protein